MGRHLPPGFDAMPELNVLCGSDRLVPDLTVARQSARYVNGDLADGPDLAVEILSSGQLLVDVLDRCNRLLKAGTAMCWIIWPERRRAWNYSSNDLAEIGPLSSDLIVEVESEGSFEVACRYQSMKFGRSWIVADCNQFKRTVPELQASTTKSCY